MTTDAGLLRQVGETLYGDRWRVGLSDALEVTDRTIRRWIVGGQDIPDGVWRELMALTFRHRIRIASVNDAVVNKVESLQTTEA